MIFSAPFHIVPDIISSTTIAVWKPSALIGHQVPQKSRLSGSFAGDQSGWTSHQSRLNSCPQAGAVLSHHPVV